MQGLLCKAEVFILETLLHPLLSQSSQTSYCWWFRERTTVLICLGCEYKNIPSKLQAWLYLVNALYKIKCLRCGKMFVSLRLFSCQNIEDFQITVNLSCVCVRISSVVVFQMVRSSANFVTDCIDNLLALWSSYDQVYGSRMSFSNYFFQVVVEYQQKDTCQKQSLACTVKGCENKVMFSWEQVFCYEIKINNENKHCIKKMRV